MCGCNSNVKFTKGEVANVPEYTVKAPTHKVITSCDSLGSNCNIVEGDTFQTSEQVHNGGNFNFTRNRTSSAGSNFPKESFYIQMSNNVYLTAIGLRQLAEQAGKLADELDGQKTVIQLAVPASVIRAKKRKAAKKKKVTSKK